MIKDLQPSKVPLLNTDACQFQTNHKVSQYFYERTIKEFSFLA
jgi:hypothetical protein